MKFAIFSLTRDRLAYTKTCFASLREKAGLQFDHYVIDNGSEDGTYDWLLDEYKPYRVVGFNANMGISIASNSAVNRILVDTPASEIASTLIIKTDNDCKVITPNILAAFASIYSETEAERWVLSPRVEGINNQPKRVREHSIAGWRIGVTAIVGGLFQVVPASIYREFMADGGFDEKLPRGWGQDDWLCDWLARNSYAKGYVEDLGVEHYLGTTGQHLDMPSYTERKWSELAEDKGERT